MEERDLVVFFLIFFSGLVWSFKKIRAKKDV